jgi:cyclophilin family peptidyl-prolyl cis-trans isomerase
MAVCIRGVVLGLVLVIATASLSAQEKAPAAKPGPKHAAFNQVFAEWKKLLEELRGLREEYGKAKPDRKEEIEKQYDQLIAKGDELQPKVIDAAMAAYQEAPTANEELADFLKGLVYWYWRSDDYEKALAMGKTLIEANIPDNNVYNWVAISAFCTGDFDTAETYFQKADKSGVLDAMGKQFRSDLDYYKDAWKKELAARDAEAKANDLPRVLLKTSQGDIEIELLENEAPNTVANFISLVEKGFYNGLKFHRVLPGFMAQGGDPNGDGSGGPGYTIPDEVNKPNHRLHFRGSLSMAKTAAPDSGGSQFFLCFVPTKHLDGKHTVFGRVVKGEEVLARLHRVDPEGQNPAPPDKILEAKVLRKRNHPYEPKTIAEKEPERKKSGK